MSDEHFRAAGMGDNDGASASGSASASASRPADNLTSAHWDGWPTEPTPAYLIPAMGKVPVSSTVHFQTVAMTSLGEDAPAEEWWRKLRAPLLKALRAKAEAEVAPLVITFAEYGDLNPGNYVDVAARVRELIRDGALDIEVRPELFEDPAPDAPKTLSVGYKIDGHGDQLWGEDVNDGDRMTLPGALSVTRATWGDLSSGRTADVTAAVESRVAGNKLVITADNGTLGTDPAPGMDKSLRIEYSILGAASEHTVAEGETLSLPRYFRVMEANYGVMPGRRVFVTDKLRLMIDDNAVEFEVADINLDVTLDIDRPKQISVHYTVGEEKLTATAWEGENLRIESRPKTYTPEGIYEEFFSPTPRSLRSLAQSFVEAGLLPTDFDDETDEFANMVEALESVIGIDRRGRLDPLGNAHPDDMDRPAEGVILYQEQGWFGRGLALGNLLHCVALAPGEVTQVAMTHWNHTTRATDSETVSQSDTAAESSLQNRAVSEIQDSTLHEHTSGGSAASSASQSAAAATSSVDAKASFNIFSGLKGSMSGTDSSFGSSHTVSNVSTHSEGDKSLAMGANQNVNAATQRHAEAARTRRASVVREISQSEDETLTTRVVANYNHMHALTVMYYEVVEVYSLKTRVVDAERVIFLPFQVRDVRELVSRYRGTLIEAARAVGREDMAEAIELYHDGKKEITELTKRIAQIDAELTTSAGGDAKGHRTLADREDEIGRAIVGLPKLMRQSLGELQTRVDAIDKHRATLMAEIAKLHELPEMLSGLAVRELQKRLQPLDQKANRLEAELATARQAEQRLRDELFARREALLREMRELRARRARHKVALRQLELLADGGPTGPFHDNRLYFNQAVWLSLSAGEVLSLARRLYEFNGETLYDTVDPTPVAITGNFVGYRWRIRDQLESQRFKRQFVEPFVGDPENELGTVSADIAVPTGGIFGEAVLGNGVSAEKIDLSRFWNWQDSMIPILPTSINPLTAVKPTMQDLNTEPSKLDESSAKFTPLQDLPAPSGFDAMAQTMRAQVFRDMSGQSMLQSLADATTKAAASSEQNAAQIASQNLKAGLDFVSDMASKALAAAAASETGGASLLGSMASSKGGGGGPSLLGGVLNAEGAGGGELFSKMTGGKSGLTDQVAESLLGGLGNAGAGTAGSSSQGGAEGGSGGGRSGVTDGGSASGGDEGGSSGEDGVHEDGPGGGKNIPASELEPNPHRPGDP